MRFRKCSISLHIINECGILNAKDADLAGKIRRLALRYGYEY